MLYCLGVLAGTLALVSPLDELGEQKLLTAHMAQHLVIGDIAPLLIVLGLRGPMSFFVLPSSVLRRLGHIGVLRTALRLLLRPSVSFAIWAAVVYGWHIPAAYDAAIAHPALHQAEHATFFLAGLLVWTQILDPGRQRRLGAGARSLYAVGVLAAGMPLAETLILAGAVYPHYRAILHRPLGLTAAQDQSRAGLLMTAEQIVTLVTAAAMLLWDHLEELEQNAPQPDTTRLAHP